MAMYSTIEQCCGTFEHDEAEFSRTDVDCEDTRFLNLSDHTHSSWKARRSSSHESLWEMSDCRIASLAFFWTCPSSSASFLFTSCSTALRRSGKSFEMGWPKTTS